MASGQSVPGITQGAAAAAWLAASGAYVNVGTGPRSDDVLAAVSRGELIVPTHMVQAGAVDHLRGKIPGFAGGGLVLAGDKTVLTGDYAVTQHTAFVNTGAASMETAMLNAARSAGAAFADGGVVSGGGSGGAVRAGPGDLLAEPVREPGQQQAVGLPGAAGGAAPLNQTVVRDVAAAAVAAVRADRDHPADDRGAAADRGDQGADRGAAVRVHGVDTATTAGTTATTAGTTATRARPPRPRRGPRRPPRAPPRPHRARRRRPRTPPR